MVAVVQERLPVIVLMRCGECLISLAHPMRTLLDEHVKEDVNRPVNGCLDMALIMRRDVVSQIMPTSRWSVFHASELVCLLD
jgi:hypothetical protein